MIRTRLLATALCAAALPLSLGGCLVAAVAVGAAAAYGAVKYTDNEAYRDFHAGLDATWTATLTSMRELGYPVQEGAAHGPTEGLVEINDAKVSVTREAGDYTRVKVRIGTFSTDDHRRRAALILDRISTKVD